ncbi:MAG: rRNA maturation RNase YbeY [Elainellaceae cyanobacterium]
MEASNKTTSKPTPCVDVGLQIGPIDRPTAASSTPEDAVAAAQISQRSEKVDLFDLRTWSHWMGIWLASLEADLSSIGDYELGILLTSDSGIQQFNRDYRHYDKATDVLAFVTGDDELAPDWATDCPVYLGDIVISVETAQRQARDRGHSLVYEVAWLAAHGLLHLLGWDHPDDDQLEQMLHQQDLLLSLVGFSDRPTDDAV